MRYLLVGLPFVFSLVFVLFSFIKGTEFYIFNYSLAPLQLLLLSGVLYYTMMVFWFLDSRESFKSRIEILQMFFLHAVNSFFLMFIGEFSLAVALQFLVPLWLLKKPMMLFLSLFLLFEHIVLLKLFASGHYSLYFLAFGFVAFFLWMHKQYFHSVSLAFTALIITVLSLAGFVFEELLFDIYVWLDVVDKSCYIDRNVFYVLTILHVFTIFLIKHKKQRRFKKN